VPHDHAIHQLIRVPCQVRHSEPGGMDEYGDHPIAVLTVTDERCYLTQSTRAEEGDVETERWQVYFLPWTDIDANDTVDVDGMALEVIGNPWKVIDPVTGYRTHIECTAVRRR
jgi:hypothetical protein